MWLSSEINTVLIGAVLAIISAATPMAVAWFRKQTKRLNEQAEENRAILEENTKLTQQIQKQTDGLTKKMTEIASVVGFHKGQTQGREEGAGNKPYEALTNLEEEIARIMQKDYTKSGPIR